MSTTAIAAPAPPEAVWTRASEHLYAGRIPDFLALWHDDCRYEVAYPVDGFPAVVAGREELGRLFAGFASLARSIAVRDVRLHRTRSAGVVFVEETMEVELISGERFENRLVMRVTFRDGLIAEIFEYYGQRAHEDLLRAAGLLP